MIEVRCFESLTAAAHLHDAAAALNRAAARPDPFQTFECLAVVLRDEPRSAPGHGLWLLAAFRDGQLVGYLPLRQRTRRVAGLPSAALGFLAPHLADRPQAVARPADLPEVSRAFLEHLLARRREWSVLEFAGQDAASVLYPPPPGIDLRHHRVHEWADMENCTVRVRWPSLQAYFEALSKKFRGNLERQLGALFAAGRVELLASSDPRVTPALLALYLAIEPHSWKAQTAAGIGRDPRQLAGLHRLLGADQPMRVSIQLLLLDGLPIAGLVNGAFERGLYALHIVYDDRFRRLGPGSAMLLLGMREAIAGGHAFYNLLSGFGYYKSRWLADVTTTRVAQIYRRGSLPCLQRVVGDWTRRLGAAATQAMPPRFNPLRRAAMDRGRPADAPAAAGESARVAALLAGLRRGPCAHWSAAELAAALPRRVSRGAPVPCADALHAVGVAAVRGLGLARHQEGRLHEGAGRSPRAEEESALDHRPPHWRRRVSGAG